MTIIIICPQGHRIEDIEGEGAIGGGSFSIPMLTIDFVQKRMEFRCPSCNGGYGRQYAVKLPEAWQIS